jgi:histidinol-phosphatase (PHP family)
MAFRDYHTHTRLCKHASGEPEDYAAAAVRAGLAELGVSDHCPWPSGYDTRWRMSPAEFPLYRDIVAGLKGKVSGVKIKYGIEIDWVPGRMDGVEENISGESFDYIIGSIHYIDGTPFDSEESLEEWRVPGKAEKLWRRYAELLYDFAEWGRFDIIAHPDLPKKFGFKTPAYDKFLESMDKALAKAAEKNIALEINTGGLRKPVGEMYPSEEILRLAAARGMAVTFGSDAHCPGDVGANFREAAELAKKCGVTRTVSFTQRKKTLLDIQAADSHKG